MVSTATTIRGDRAGVLSARAEPACTNVARRMHKESVCVDMLALFTPGPPHALVITESSLPGSRRSSSTQLATSSAINFTVCTPRGAMWHVRAERSACLRRQRAQAARDFSRHGRYSAHRRTVPSADRACAREITHKRRWNDPCPLEVETTKSDACPAPEL